MTLADNYPLLDDHSSSDTKIISLFPIDNNNNNTATTTTMIQQFDLIIAIAYFSIPVQILVSLYRYPRLAAMPWSIFILSILFVLFIALCGTGHLLRYLHIASNEVFTAINGTTAVVSMVTALYLIPLVPSLMSKLDQQIQDLIKAKEDTATFNAFLIHEIRQPLFAISASLDFLEADLVHTIHENDISNLDMTLCTETQRENRENIRVIRQSTSHILRLVNNCVDFSKMQCGDCDFDTRVYNFRELVRSIATTTRKQLRDTVQLHCHFDPAVPSQILGDPFRMKQILYNITSNASKFTTEGSIEINVSTVPFDEAKRNQWIHRKATNSTVDGAIHHQTTYTTALSFTNAENGISSSNSNATNRGSSYCNLPSTAIHKKQNSQLSTYTDCTEDNNDSDRIEKLEQGLIDSPTSTTVSCTASNTARPNGPDGTTNPMRRNNDPTNTPPISGGSSASSSSPSLVSVVKIEISDTGCGISNDRLCEMFAPYLQAKKSHYNTRGGSGLGLSIVSMLIKMMEGTVHVTSKEGCGTTFTVYLPLILPSAEDSTTSTQTKRQTGFLSSADEHEYYYNNVNGTTAHNHNEDGLGFKDEDNEGSNYPSLESMDITQLVQDKNEKDLNNHLNSERNGVPAALTDSVASTESSTTAASTSIVSFTGDETSSPPTKHKQISTVGTETKEGARAPTTVPVVPNGSKDTTLSAPSSPVIPSSPTSSLGTDTSPRTRGRMVLHTIKTKDTVLVVDDNEMNRKLIGRMLSSHNVPYQLAEDGKQAIQLLLQSRNVYPKDTTKPYYGLIFMDWQMPVMGGCEATRLIRQQHRLTVPIIALTANVGYVFRDEAMNAGCTEFTTKPIRITEVLSLCEKYLTVTPTSSASSAPSSAQSSVLPV